MNRKEHTYVAQDQHNLWKRYGCAVSRLNTRDGSTTDHDAGLDAGAEIAEQ
jgi:hypothetical protein